MLFTVVAPSCSAFFYLGGDWALCSRDLRGADNVSVSAEPPVFNEKVSKWSEEIGVAFGRGIGLKVFGFDVSDDLVLAKFYYGWNRERTYFEDRWYEGQFGLFQEFMAGGGLPSE
ncbi:MAG: hypothetical protein M2R45_04823 [Verrucomicrobia subdivision 3 bacterium]|nr:hypothetical protein [Limisphaerales bacterium]MCS1417288.1 hypothetical protein [Limisphaerales bacterium]